MSIVLQLPRRLLDEMIFQARTEIPDECCGLLAGRVVSGVGIVTVRYPIRNALASA